MVDTVGESGRDRDAIDRVLPVIYEELRRIAHFRLRAEQTGNTLETTGLVHEAYLRLVGSEHLAFESHAHFLAIAAQAMRHILIDSALARRTQKRGGGVQPLSIDAVPIVAEERSEEVLALDEALQRLSVDQRATGARGGVPLLRRHEHRRDGARARLVDGDREARLDTRARVAQSRAAAVMHDPRAMLASLAQRFAEFRSSGAAPSRGERMAAHERCAGGLIDLPKSEQAAAIDAARGRRRGVARGARVAAARAPRLERARCAGAGCRRGGAATCARNGCRRGAAR